MAKTFITEDNLQNIANSLHIGNNAPSERAMSIQGNPVDPSINNQDKTVIPTESKQYITADTGYTGLGTVTVNAISSTYIGSNVAKKTAATIIPSTINQEIPTNTYLTGKQTILGDADLIADNIKSGVQIFGVTGSYVGEALNLQEKEISPNETQQEVMPDNDYNGLSKVTVNAINNTYVGSGITRRNSTNLTTSGATVTAPAGYYAGAASKSVATATQATPTVTINKTTGVVTGSAIQTAGYVAAGTKSGTLNLTTVNGSTITPTESEQTAVAADRYTLGAVKVGAISSTYIGSGVTQRDSDDLTASGATVTVPAGYYSAQVTKSVTTMSLPTSASSSATSGYTSKATISRSTSDQYINIAPGYNSAGGYYKINAIANGSVTAPSSISGSSATVSTGTNTLTLTKSVSVTPNVTTAGYISAGTAGNSSISLTASVITKAAATITPGTSNQTIASGTYLTGTQTISGDADLTAANIKQGTQIFGVTGSYTSDATAAASDIVSGQTAYVNGSKVTGDLIINKYYTGSTAPSSSLGSNGDIYFQS